MPDQPSPPTTPPPPDDPDDAGPWGPTDDAVAADEGRRRRRKLRVIIASVITGSLVTGGASYAVLSSRGTAEHLAGDAHTDNPTYVVPEPGTLPAPRWGRGPYAGALADTTGTAAATDAQQVGVVDIYTVSSDGSEAAGTGMVLSSDGEILTNNHVVDGATQIQVVVASTGKGYDATVVGTDAGDDVAVLQLDDAGGLATVDLDTSGDLSVGDTVTGVGNAGGAGGDPSAATGKVIALHRNITVHDESGSGTEHLHGLIEVDADIIAGDSGGPLLDDDNEVVGMDTAASSGRADVTGFAIPIARAVTIADDIEAGA
jgi:S1-C subfamily serine protease